MSKTGEPNPPSRRTEDFPKTNTMPEGWVMDELMSVYNRNGSVYDRGVEVDLDTPASIPVPPTGKVNGGAKPEDRTDGRAHESSAEPAKMEQDGLFSRRLDPFPSTADLSRAYL